MIKVKKFGSFAGVFTPSILTILGVIMYLRLGWVVGQAGLISALVIIIIAHIISVSTGLSISSIATDKKIKVGGIYYILSRSLGLPIGGSIGIALLIGTALSISLYLVGFAESFLSIEAIRTFTGLEQDVNGYRIISTVAILILVILAFISTSLAIKTQFYILGAIGLSLISIFVGFFVHTEFAPESVIIPSLQNGVSLEIVFAVFFPAVTGFTAGVAMSGDLKNPKKAIPLGTMSAIAIGFVVYVVLAIGFAVFVNRDLLANDYNFLLKIAWFSPFVIAGIWGATLSSALGGILGGPRILQAISTDRITPKIFAKGYGGSNEPRNALILIFIIAEAGILIGNLNVIAGIVSMFFLASYGFINLAFFLESWASTDFRPSFKVNRYIGLTGFIVAFGVMFNLDMVSMFAALIIMLGLYFFLKRKQLKSEYGDVWQSVYSSLVRSALLKMNKSNIEQRNWRPNIVLFSGGTKKRPHLIDFGKCIVGKHGVLSNFDLIENKNAKIILPKHKQSLPAEDTDPGIFTRRKTVKDIYDGIESISGVYGFSGFEPNTVLLGWTRQTHNPERFAEMLNTLYDLDLNVLLLDYDKKAGFGNFNLIDIWWKDMSNQGNFALTLSKLLVFSNDWQNADIRLIIVNSRNDQSDNILRKAEHLLDYMRVNATVKVINNQIEQKPYYEIVLSESRNTDLVISGIPEIEKGKEAEFVNKTNKLLNKIGTVLLIKASSNFKKLNLGIDTDQLKYISEKVDQVVGKDIKIQKVEYPAKEEVASELTALYESIFEIINNFHQEYILPALKFNINKTFAIEQNINEAFKTIESKSFLSAGKKKQKGLIASIKTNQLVRIIKILEEFQKTINSSQKTELDKGLSYLITEIGNAIQNVPLRITIAIFKYNLLSNNEDKLKAKFFKRFKRIIHSEKSLEDGISYSIKYKKLIKSYLPERVYQKLDETLDKFGQYSIWYIIEFQKLLNSLNKYFDIFEQKEITPEIIFAGKKEISEILKKLNELNEKAQVILYESLLNEISVVITEIGKQTENVPANPDIKKQKSGMIKNLCKNISNVPERWASNRFLLYNGAIIEIKLFLIKYRLQKIIDKTLAEIQQTADDKINSKLRKLDTYINKYIRELKNDKSVEFVLPDNELQLDEKNDFKLSLNKITDKANRNIKAIVNKLPETTEFLSAGSLNEVTNIIFEEVNTVSISTYQLVDYYVQSNLLEPLLSITETLPADIHEATSKIKDTVRLISLGSIKTELLSTDDEVLYDLDSPESYRDRSDFVLFAEEQLKIIRKIVNHIKEIIESVQQELNEHITLTSDELSIYRLLKTPDKYKQYVIKREAQRKMSVIRKRMSGIKHIIQKQKANLWYKQSDAFLFAKKISEGEQEKLSIIDSLLNLKESVSPKLEVLNKIPFYYRQLFLHKYNYQSEFWFNRQKELKEVEKAISRYSGGYSGAILIKGERKSGKTFFTNYIASTLYINRHVYTITPPSAGSVDNDVFVKTLRDVTRLRGSYNNIFSRLPENSMIIIDDLELWWEKSENGTAVINLIIELIRKYGHKCLFVITVNNESYHIINQMTVIESYFLSVIDLLPFNALGLQEVIMFRHKLSGLDLRIANKQTSKLNNTELAKLFAKYFNYSKGNVGLALSAWVANITDVKERTILIKHPQIPDVSVLDNLSPDILVYLLQFILHKRLDIQKLQRITLDQEEDVCNNILFLKRAGLINEIADHIFELNKYLFIHVKNIISWK